MRHRIDGLHLILPYRIRNSDSSLPEHYTVSNRQIKKMGGTHNEKRL